MRHRLSISMLVLSVTLTVGCAPRYAKSNNDGSSWALGSWKMPAMPWSKDDGAATAGGSLAASTSSSASNWKMPKMPWSKKAGHESIAYPDSNQTSNQAMSNWKMPKMPWSKDKGLSSAPAWNVTENQIGEPTTADKFSTAMQGMKESKFAQGMESAWNKTKTTLTTLPKSDAPPWKGKSSSDPLSLATKTPEPNAEMHLSMAQVMEGAGQNTKAEEHFRQALAIEPTNLTALLGHAHLLDRQGKLAEATTQYQIACQHHPAEAKTFNDLGLCFARQQRLPESVAALQKAVALKPQRKLYRNNLATVLTQSQRPDEAYQQLVAAHGPAIAHYNMGFLLNKTGNTQQAAYHFREAAKADPSLASARRWADHLTASLPQASPRGGSFLPTSQPVAYPSTTPTPGVGAATHPRPSGNPLR